MFLDKYLDDVYLDLIYDNYDEKYLAMIDEENFKLIYQLLKTHNFYFIDDIIVKYLELFTLDQDAVKEALSIIKNNLGADYVQQIGSDMTIIDDIIHIASQYNF